MMLIAFFQTAGLIFGPAIILAGLIALVVCYQAAKSGVANRRPVLVALIPFGLGIVGAIFGLSLMAATGRVGEIQWWALGEVCLDGWFVTSIPLVWAASLVRNRPASA